MDLKEASRLIIDAAIRSAMPDEAVRRALDGRNFPGKVHLVAIGKAAWQMASAASDCLGSKITDGLVITKYDHCKGLLPNLMLYEAGHPVPDENSYKATEAAIELVKDLTPEDTVLFLISGGGSALFEKPLIPEEEMKDITAQLLACGADICEMNAIRKRLSAVKGGRFGAMCAPAKVLSIVLSDIIGDPLDMIASGPAYPDSTTAEDAERIIETYKLRLSTEAQACIGRPLPTKEQLAHVESIVTGSVKQLCISARETCAKLGIPAVILNDRLDCEARLAGAELARIAGLNAGNGPIALIEGGETVVKLKGKGKGGRNQEIALAAAKGISGLANTAVFSVGSDGTDGPTDAAGGYVDCDSYRKMTEKGIDADAYLADNDAYNALEAVDGLIITGPTGTNVNDLTVLLML